MRGFSIFFVVGLRSRRAVARAAQVIDAPIETAAVFSVYDPRRTAGAFAAALGAGSFGSGGQGTSAAVMDVVNWGEREARDHETLPPKLLVVTTEQAVHVFAWPTRRPAEPTARWERSSFTAKLTRHRIAGQVDVYVILPDRKIAFLSTKAGIFHRSSLACAEAITRLSSTPGLRREATE